MNDLLKQYLYYAETKGDPATPYLSADDFPGLNHTDGFFANDDGRRVNYYIYSYEGFRLDKMVLFIHGIGPGHKAYVREIEMMAKAGYKVLTFDWAGSGNSEGEGMLSLFSPLKDAVRLLEEYKKTQGGELPEILLMGHSLGSFSVLKMLALKSQAYEIGGEYAKIMSGINVKKAIILAPFYEISWSADRFTGSQQEEIYAYENAYAKELAKIKTEEYLKNTTDDIFFIHSVNDPISPFEKWTDRVMKNITNPHIEFYVNEGRGHNPDYSEEAVGYINTVFGEYGKLVAEGVLSTLEKRLDYMKDKSAMKMTTPDAEIKELMLKFMEK